MISKSTLMLLIIALLASSSIYLMQHNNPKQAVYLKYQSNPNAPQLTFRSISSVLRAKLSRIYTFNDTIYAGDLTGALGVWSYDAKKKKLQALDLSRQITPVLPSNNKVIHLQGDSAGSLVLTEDGKLTSYAINAQSKIIGNSSIALDQLSSWFTIIKIQSNESTQIAPIIAIINNKKSQLCLYSLYESVARPNPVTKILCNSSISTVQYDHVAYDPMNSYISVGDQNKAIVFKISINADKKVELKYLAQSNLAKVDNKGFKSIFSNGTLLAINDLWLFSFIVDATVPTLRLVSSERTQKIVKSGQTTQISALFDAKLKKSLTAINSKDRIQFFSVTNNKLNTVNDSKTIGRCQSFMLRDETILFAAVDQEILALKIGDTQEKDYLAIQDDITIASDNHLRKVRTIAYWNNTVVTGSDGAKFNLKLWTYNPSNYKLSYVDQKSMSYFSILKSGYINVLSSVMIPPTTKKQSNANVTLHVALAVADPFSLYIVPVVASTGKFGAVFRSKDEHSSNVTAIFLSEDKKQIITGSLDSTIKVWTLTANHDQVQDNTTTISTRNGPISCGVQDKTGQYYAFCHNNNNFNRLINITIWKADVKHGLVKLADNSPSQSPQTNLTSIVITHDQKYLITLAQSGEIRLWRHEGWTMVDLMGSLGLGVYDATIQATQSNTLLVQSQKFFVQYSYDQNGFILLGRTYKTYQVSSNSSLLVGKTWFSGGNDGSIRIYTYQS